MPAKTRKMPDVPMDVNDSSAEEMSETEDEDLAPKSSKVVKANQVKPRAKIQVSISYSRHSQ